MFYLIQRLQGNGEEDRIIQVGALIIDSRGQVKYFDELCSSEVEIKFDGDGGS